MSHQLTDLIDPSARRPVLSWTLLQSLYAADEVIRRLRSWGVRLPPGNRVEESRDLVAHLLDAEYPGNVTRGQLAATQRSVIEQYLIVRCIPRVDARLADCLFRAFVKSGNKALSTQF